jgi:protein-S-isoprenylcysteine O-methyltransferase Ste14
MIDPWRLLIVAIIWIGWSVQHSLLNDTGALGARIWEKPFIRPYYRIIYNVVAVVTLALAISYTPTGEEIMVIKWRWPWVIIPAMTMTLALIIFALTFKQLDLSGFSGLGSLRGGQPAASDSGGLVTDGVYGVVRHPQFSAGILALWSRDLSDTSMVINIVLCAYMLIGARMEEKRLIRQFGDEYRDYMDRVPGFIPDKLPGWRELIMGSKIT